jgi:hypothetical protein
LPNVVAQTGTLLGGLQTALVGTIGPNLEKLGFKPDFSGLILLMASIFAILIGAIIWNGQGIKDSVKFIPAGVAAGALR